MSRLRLMSAILRGLASTDSWRQLQLCDVLLVRGDADCGYTFGSKCYSPILDSVGDLLTARGLTVNAVSIPHARLIGDRAHFAPVSYNRSNASAELLSLLVQVRDGREARARWLKERMVGLWSKMLALSRPRFVIAINPESALCRAARLADITVYDIQHGVVDAGNTWYDERSGAGVDLQDLPHGFLCWDEPTAGYLRGWAVQKGLEVHVIGNPWLTRFSRREARDDLVRAALASAPQLRNGRGVILVSLQWGLKSFYYPDPEFDGMMVDALEAAIRRTADRYTWLLRLHPQHLRGDGRGATLDYLQRTFGQLKSVEWERCSRAPLPLVLSQADLHITDSSSVVIEAARMGVRSALLNPRFQPGQSLSHVYSHQRESGMADAVRQDPDVIAAWVDRNLVVGKRADEAMHHEHAMSELLAAMHERCRPSCSVARAARAQVR